MWGLLVTIHGDTGRSNDRISCWSVYQCDPSQSTTEHLYGPILMAVTAIVCRVAESPTSHQGIVPIWWDTNTIVLSHTLYTWQFSWSDHTSTFVSCAWLASDVCNSLCANHIKVAIKQLLGGHPIVLLNFLKCCIFSYRITWKCNSANNKEAWSHVPAA